MTIALSYLSVFVFLTASLDHVVLASFSFRPPNSTCVWTERQLRKVIESASNETRTRITLCRQNISISSTRNRHETTGIDVTGRIIDLKCYLKRSKGICTLDGRLSSRIFYGFSADLTVRNVLFYNSKPNDCDFGGAIDVSTSNVLLNGCSFINNGNNCASGGAIQTFKSVLKINGGSKKRPVMFSENEGGGCGALNALGSEVSIDGFTVFSNNSGYRGAVYLDQSTFNIKNVKFEDNFGEDVSALSSLYSQSTIRNVVFIGNNGEGPVNKYDRSSLLAMNCTFANNIGMGIKAELSKITLKKSIFSNNTSTQDASNIYIDDDKDPLDDGTFVKCESNVVFCNGLGEDSIDEVGFDNTIGSFSNTDCNSEGLQGTPGQGNCPI